MPGRVSVSQITILSALPVAASAFAMSRLPRFDEQSRPYFLVAIAFAAVGVALHAQNLFALMLQSATALTCRSAVLHR